MFQFIKETLHKIYSQCTARFAALFSQSLIDENTLKQLEQILIEADAGIILARALIGDLKKSLQKNPHLSGTDLKKLLFEQLQVLLATQTYNPQADIYLLVGINGSGKTTSAGKLAFHATQQGKNVILVAADTFRAAAVEQLALWAQKCQAPFIKGKEGQDPASVVFAACQAFQQNQNDLLIIDTAGRLQTKVNLMKELEKIRRIISQQLPGKTVKTLLVIDAMLGQNSFEQAKLFHESTYVDGIILTKMDSTAKGGIVFAITQALKIPIAYLACGEKSEDLYAFDASEYIHKLLNE
ncbi:MAG: signal recognition particle-docking protein FtsY [Candidatus Babeliaceae bacterium]